MNKPLKGIKILDLSWVFSAPFSTLMLQDLGADVVKLERPNGGDRSRALPPFKNSESGYFYMLNRDKKSISINLKEEKGKELFLNLVKEFDVVVENFVSGTMDNLGLGYEVMKKINPSIIFATLNGFGTDSPYANLPSIDGIAQAMGGLMSQNGMEKGMPLKTGPAVADSISGIYLTIGILSALINRNKTGEGERIEVSMMDSVFSILEESVIRTSMTGEAPTLRGNKDLLGAPWDSFQSKEGDWIIVCAAGNDRFKKVFEGIDRQDIVKQFEGDDLAAFEKRANNLDMLNDIFASWAKEKTTSELLEFLSELHVPAGKVMDTNDLLKDSHIKQRNMVIDVNHPELGEVKLPNIPIKFSESEIGLKKGDIPIAPDLGEHTMEVLKEMVNMSQEEIKELKDDGIIFGSKPGKENE